MFAEGSIANFPMRRQSIRQPLDRSVCAQAIARLLYAQHNVEAEAGWLKLEDADPPVARRFHDGAEFITNALLSPDRFQAAVMAAADAICVGTTGGQLNLFEVSRRAQTQYYATAISVVHALMENVKDVPPDASLHGAYARLLEVLAPKGGGQ